MVFFVGLLSPKSCLKKLTNWRLYELLDSVCYKTLPILYVIFLLQQINILNSKLICEEWAILKQGCTQGSSAPKWNGLDVNDTLMSSKRVKDLLLSTQKSLLVVNIFSPKPIFFYTFCFYNGQRVCFIWIWNVNGTVLVCHRVFETESPGTRCLSLSLIFSFAFNFETLPQAQCTQELSTQFHLPRVILWRCHSQ